jgi:hypothetical protein
VLSEQKPEGCLKDLLTINQLEELECLSLYSCKAAGWTTDEQGFVSWKIKEIFPSPQCQNRFWDTKTSGHWALGLSSQGKAAEEEVASYLYLVPRLRMHGVIYPSQYIFMACCLICLNFIN